MDTKKLIEQIDLHEKLLVDALNQIDGYSDAHVEMCEWLKDKIFELDVWRGQVEAAPPDILCCHCGQNVVVNPGQSCLMCLFENGGNPA